MPQRFFLDISIFYPFCIQSSVQILPSIKPALTTLSQGVADLSHLLSPYDILHNCILKSRLDINALFFQHIPVL